MFSSLLTAFEPLALEQATGAVGMTWLAAVVAVEEVLESAVPLTPLVELPEVAAPDSEPQGTLKSLAIVVPSSKIVVTVVVGAD